MEDDVLRKLAKLRAYATGLQDLIADFERVAPKSNRGSDRTDTVEAVLGATGMPEVIRVAARWKEKLSPESFGAAVVEACRAAWRERGLAWGKALEQAGWQEKVDRLEADAAAAPASPVGVVPPAFGRPPAAGTRRRPLEAIADDAMKLLDAAAEQAEWARTHTRVGVGTSRDGGLTVQVTPDGQLSCDAKPRWVAERSGEQLTNALNAALKVARQQLAAAVGAADTSRADLVERQHQLMADLEAATWEPHQLPTVTGGPEWRRRLT